MPDGEKPYRSPVWNPVKEVRVLRYKGSFDERGNKVL
jgi:hypothetical protein